MTRDGGKSDGGTRRERRAAARRDAREDRRERNKRGDEGRGEVVEAMEIEGPR